MSRVIYIIFSIIGWDLIFSGMTGLDELVKSPENVIPANRACHDMTEAGGIHKYLKTLDSATCPRATHRRVKSRNDKQ